MELYYKNQPTWSENVSYLRYKDKHFLRISLVDSYLVIREFTFDYEPTVAEIDSMALNQLCYDDVVPSTKEEFEAKFKEAQTFCKRLLNI